LSRVHFLFPCWNICTIYHHLTSNSSFFCNKVKLEKLIKVCTTQLVVTPFDDHLNMTLDVDLIRYKCMMLQAFNRHFLHYCFVPRVFLYAVPRGFIVQCCSSVMSGTSHS
jgi:hypothetical protein